MHPFNTLAIPENKVGIHWFGQSSFALKHPDGAVIQVDPYFPRERPTDRFIHAEPPLDETTLKTDFVLLTHNHGDHTCIESLKRIRDAFPHCHYIGPPESVANMLKNDFSQNTVTEITAEDVSTLGPMTVHAVWAKPPRGVPEDGIKPPDVQHLGYVVEVGIVRIYISGDPINTFANHETLTLPIASLQPDIGLLTTHPTEGEFPFFEGSVDMALTLGLSAAAPAHYQCFVKRTYDPAEWAAQFPAEGPDPIVIPYNTSIVYPAG